MATKKKKKTSFQKQISDLQSTAGISFRNNGKEIYKKKTSFQKQISDLQFEVSISFLKNGKEIFLHQKL
jgi:hypothetical protein